MYSVYVLVNIKTNSHVNQKANEFVSEFHMRLKKKYIFQYPRIYFPNFLLKCGVFEGIIDNNS